MNGSVRRLKPSSFSQIPKILMSTTMGVGNSGTLVALPVVLMEGLHSLGIS